MKITNAMVLAAGLGTRMRPLTESMPKPLVTVAGKPLIDYALDHLADAGIERVVVNIHHFPERMIEHLDRYKRLEIIISDEREALLNNGGGLVRGLPLLSDGPVIVMNSDLFWLTDGEAGDDNISRLMNFFDPEIMDIAMLCVPPGRTTGHSEKNDFSLDGDGRLTRFAVKTDNPVIYAGVKILMPSLLRDAPSGPFNINIYYDRAIARGRLHGMLLNGHWLTVGTPDAIGAAEMFMRERAGR